MHVAQRPGDRLGAGERDVLLVVVGENQVPTSSVIDAEQLVALLLGHVTGATNLVEQDLDVDLVVGRVDPRGVVDEVGADPPARLGVLDPAALGETEVAALADRRGRSAAPSTRIASFALSPASALVSVAALT